MRCKNIKVEVTQVLDMDWHVTAVDKDGKGSMTQRINNVKLVMDTPQGKIEVDSKDDKEPTDATAKSLAKMVRGLSGGEVTLTLDLRGQIGDVKLSEKMAQFVKDLPVTDKALGEAFSEEGFKKMMNQSGIVFPEKSPKKGDTWSHRLESKAGPVKSIYVFKNTLDGSVQRGDRKVEKITMKPTLSMELEENTGLELKVKNQEGSGTVYFDRAAGRIVESSINQNVEFEVTGMGQAITQKMEIRASMKLVEPRK